MNRFANMGKHDANWSCNNALDKYATKYYMYHSLGPNVYLNVGLIAHGKQTVSFISGRLGIK